MEIIIRTDASYDIGTGHVMRCLALADYLTKNKSARVTFLCRELPGNLCDYIGSKGYSVYSLKDESFLTYISELPNKPDLLIVDHYQLDHLWEKEIRKLVKKIFVIDDLANREHDCDYILDQNFFSNMQTRYSELLPNHCQKLLGPHFAILRDEFYETRKQLRSRNGDINNILVFMGGSDLANDTFKVLTGILNLEESTFHTHVVIGSSNSNRAQIESFCQEYPQKFTSYYQVSTMAKMVNEVDLVIGAGGSTTWERCFLGVPSLTIVIAENQSATTQAVANFGATINLGWHENLTSFQIADEILRLIRNKTVLLEMSKKSIILMGDPNDHGLARIVTVLDSE